MFIEKQLIYWEKTWDFDLFAACPVKAPFFTDNLFESLETSLFSKDILKHVGSYEKG